MISELSYKQNSYNIYSFERRGWNTVSGMIQLTCGQDDHDHLFE